MTAERAEIGKRPDIIFLSDLPTSELITKMTAALPSWETSTRQETEGRDTSPILHEFSLQGPRNIIQEKLTLKETDGKITSADFSSIEYSSVSMPHLEPKIKKLKNPTAISISLDNKRVILYEASEGNPLNFIEVSNDGKIFLSTAK